MTEYWVTAILDLGDVRVPHRLSCPFTLAEAKTEAVRMTAEQETGATISDGQRQVVWFLWLPERRQVIEVPPGTDPREARRYGRVVETGTQRAACGTQRDGESALPLSPAARCVLRAACSPPAPRRHARGAPAAHRRVRQGPAPGQLPLTEAP